MRSGKRGKWGQNMVKMGPKRSQKWSQNGGKNHRAKKESRFEKNKREQKSKKAKGGREEKQDSKRASKVIK